MPKPFQQSPFESLPEEPRISHPYFDSESLHIPLESSVFGPMSVHVKKHGTGPPLSLIHGLMTSSYSFRYVLEPLGERFTCYVPDLPGAGQTDPALRAPYTPQNLAVWLGEVMDALDIRGAPTIANSMGGYLALWAAMLDGDLFERVLDVHSPGVPDVRLHALRIGMAVPGVGRAVRWAVARDPVRWAHANVHYYDESLKSLEEARTYAAPLRTEVGRIAFLQYLSETMNTAAMTAFAARLRALESFPVPVLLLYAREDPMVPPRVGPALAAMIPGARLAWVEDASHFMHVDAVQRFLPPALEFLSSERP
jgi:pimeloyl-ACP methyl ester carboxylesterase